MSTDEKLNGHNYPLEAFKIKQSFAKEKVWFVVREVDPNATNAHALARRAWASANRL